MKQKDKNNESVMEYISLASSSSSSEDDVGTNISKKDFTKNVERNYESDSSIEVLPTPKKPPVPLIDLTSVTEIREENVSQENINFNNIDIVTVEKVNESVEIIYSNDDDISTILNDESHDAPNNDSVEIVNNSEPDSTGCSIELNTSVPNLEQHVTLLLQQEFENVERKRKRKRDHSEYSRKAKRPKMYDLPGSDGIYWTPDMKKFYNKSWGGENFDHKSLINSLPKNPDLWKISSADYKSSHRPSNYVKVRCFNCCQMGHVGRMCPEPRKKPRCSMCGEQGHYVSYCRHATCLLCGRPSSSYDMGCYNCRDPNPRMQRQCFNCGIKNHMPYNVCPYSWRIMHSTTSEEMGPPRLSERLKPKIEQHCPNCARIGHQYDSCPELFHFAANPYLQSTYPYNVFIPYNHSDQEKVKDQQIRIDQQVMRETINYQKKKSRDRRRKQRQKMRRKQQMEMFKKAKRRKKKRAGIQL